MDISCAAIPCPVVLNATCVFYEGNTLVYTGINSGDNLQTALQKIDAKFEDAGLGYVFVNGIIQTAPGVPVELGGSLTHDTTISGNYTLTFAGNLQATALITTGGTSSQFVKGDGSLDNTSYQPSGNYLTALTGDGTANGPGSAAFTLATVNATIGTFGTSTMVPRITVNNKGLVTNVVNTLITVPSGVLIFTGDVTGSGMTGSPVTLTLLPVNVDVYGPNTFLKFAVNAKGLVTSATLVTAFDIIGALGYTPVPTTRTITINGVTRDLSVNRTFSVGTVTNVSVSAGTGISASVVNPTNTPNITITNTAPDRIVVLNSGANINVTGVYPNFTITGTATSGGTVTSIGMTVPTGLTISGSPITTSGTLALGLDSGYSIPTISSQNTWTTAYDNSIVSAAVTGTSTKILTLTQQDAGTISASWTDTGLTSVGLNMPSAFTVSNSPLTSNGAISVTGAGTTAEYVRGDGSLATFPSLAGYVTNVTASAPISSSGGTTPNISIPAATTSVSGYLTSTDWNTFDGKQPQLNGTGFVKASGTTITYDNSTYLTTISGIAAGGELSGTYPNPTLVNSAVIGKVLTGLNVVGGSIAATDDILVAFGKVQNQINGLVGGLIYQGTWNASTNTPTLTSGVGTNGYFYIVSVAGTTNLDGNNNWHVGDWAVFHTPSWEIVDNTDSVTSVNGFIGAVVLSTTDIAEGTNLYYTDTRARNAISGGTGISYAPSTGIITNSAPDQTVALSNGTAISISGTYPSFTINNTAPDQTVVLSNGTGISVTGSYPSFTITNTAPDQIVSLTGGGTTSISGTYPSFTITSNDAYTGTVTSVGLTSGTGISIGGSTSPITTSGSFTVTNTAPDQTVSLSNGTGISVTGTYPNFTITNTSPSSGGTVTGTGTTNTLPKFTSASSIGDSNVKDNGNAVTVNATAGSFGALQVGNYNGSILMNTTSSSGGLIFQNTSSSNKLWDFSSFGDDINFNESLVAYPVMTLKAGGNIGIKQTNPSHRLDIDGTFRTTGVATFGSTLSNGTYTYTLPSATGTLALTSDIPSLTGYVPYTGATTNLNLGSFNLTSTDVTANGNVTLLGTLTGTKTVSSGSPYSLTVTQNNTNSGDTGDGALSVSHVLSGVGTGTELVTRSFIFGSDNQRTGGSVLSNSRVLYLVSSTQSGTNTTNLDQVYIEGGAMVGSVTNNRGVLVKTMQGTNQAAFVATGLTSSNRVHLLLGNYTLPTGAWGIYSGLADASYLQGNLLLGSATDDGVNKLQVTGATKITGQLTLSSTITNGTYTYTLPSATGTLALTSQIPSLTGYVTGSGNQNKLTRWSLTTSNIENSYITDADNTATTIVKDGSSITAALLSITPTTLTNASLLNLDNSGAGSFYIGRQNSAGNSVLMSGLGTYASVIGHTGAQTLHLITSSLSRLQIDGTTGAATFSSSVNIGASATTGKQLIVNQTGASGYFLSGEASGTEIAYWYYDASSIQFSSKSATRALTFLTNDAERMRIPSGGNVLIGTTTDAGYKLDVNGTGRFGGNTSSSPLELANTAISNYIWMNSATGYEAMSRYSNPTAGNWYTGIRVSAGIGTTASYHIFSSTYGGDVFALNTNGAATFSSTTEIMARFTSNTDGTIIIGGTSAQGATSGEQYITYQNATTNTNAWMVGMDDGEDFRWAYGAQGEITDANTLMKMSQSGNLLISTTTDTGIGKIQVRDAAFEVINSYYWLFNTGDSTRYGFNNTGIGSLFLNNYGIGNKGEFNMTTGVYTPLSDSTKKKDFEISKIGLNEILQLRPTLYRMKEDKQDSFKYLGFLAQEVKEFIPQAYTESGDFIGLDYQAITATLVKAIQEQQEQIKELQSQINK